MSLLDLTRNCYQAGVSAKKWSKLCQLYIAREGAATSREMIEVTLCNSVLLLYRTYPGDPELTSYLENAIQDNILSLSAFITSFLRASQSSDLHNASTIDRVCRVAVDAYFSSRLRSIEPIISPQENPSAVLRDTLALIHAVYSLPPSQFYAATVSASQLATLILSCFSDVTQLLNAGASIYVTEISSLLQNFRLSADIRQALESLSLSISFFSSDEQKSLEGHTLHNPMQMSLVKDEILSPSNNNDIVTFCLELNHALSYRATDVGVGCEKGFVSILAATFRWTAWLPNIYYTQLLLSAFTCLAQSPIHTCLLWNAFIVGRLPHILVGFEKAVNLENSANSDWRTATQIALSTVARHADLVNMCDIAISRHASSDASATESSLRDFILQCLSLNLIDNKFALALDPMLSNDNSPRIESDAREVGTELETYIEAKLNLEVSEESSAWLDRVWRDAGCHAIFSEVVLRKFITLTSKFNVEALSHLCNVLLQQDSTLDLLSIHIPISTLVCHVVQFLDRYNCETVGDPQTAVSHFGDVVLFLQSLLSRFRLRRKSFVMDNEEISTTFLWPAVEGTAPEELAGDYAVAFGAWFKTLFDSNSEGIDDAILRATPPKSLLKISTALFTQAISLNIDGKLDIDSFNSGISYFNGPLLNWTLVGVIDSLLAEIRRKSPKLLRCLETLCTIMSSSFCPKIVMALCGPHVLAYLSTKRAENVPPSAADIVTAQSNLRKVLQENIRGNIQSMISSRNLAMIALKDQPKNIIRNALMMARASKPPEIDVEYCVQSTTPLHFLHILWTEISGTSIGDIEICKRIGVFVLTTPRVPTHAQCPPLLPIFLHIYLPGLLSALDAPGEKQATEHQKSLDLLVTMISSIMTASLHLEHAGFALGYATISLARRLAMELRQNRKSAVYSTILQRLGSSPPFVANFPVFINDM